MSSDLAHKLTRASSHVLRDTRQIDMNQEQGDVTSPQARVSSPSSYRAGIALNNMATSLMRRSHYRQANETLQDAAFCMKMAFIPRSDLEETVREKLSVADQRLSRFPAATTSCESLVQVVPHDGGLATTELSNLRKQEETCVFSAIHIESNNIDMSGNSESDLASAIILYNLGVVHLCRARTGSSSSRRLYQEARKVLSMARHLLAQQYESCQDPFLLPHILFVSGILLRNMTYTLQCCGRKTAAKSCASALASIQVAARRLSAQTETVVAPRCKAAPAA